MKPLDWCPKPTGPGDMDGTGSQRLLGQPDLDQLSLLIRETAQNSWDARLPGGIPTYGVGFRELSAEAAHLLRSVVFAHHDPESTLAMTLSATELKPLRVVEIYDRGTKGLGGPLRNDLILPEGHPRDWMDFVLTLGAPPDNKVGGGTYGFGKTASYATSRCSTILIWSRVWHEGRLEHRFIASSMSASFVHDQKLYNGRQWWGSRGESTDDKHIPYPLVDGEAEKLGELLFERHFSDDETGTSLLILDPVERGSTDESDTVPPLAETLRRIVIANLWPKLTDSGTEHDMSVELSVAGKPVALPGPDASPALYALHASLRAIRRAERGGDPGDPFVEVTAVTRYKEVVGRLAFTRVIPAPDDPVGDLFLGRVSRMRTPELVVSTTAEGVPAANEANWVAVFKAAAEFDRSFAESEPPAHDGWFANSLNDKVKASRVRIAQRRVSDWLKERLSPRPSVDEGEVQTPTAALSQHLGGLIAGATGSAASHSGGGRSRGAGGAGGNASRMRAVILGTSLLPVSAEDRESGRERVRLDVEIAGPTGALEVFAKRLGVATDGNVDPEPGLVVVDRWETSRGDHDGDAACVQTGETASAIISYPAGLAVEVELSVRSRP